MKPLLPNQPITTTGLKASPEMLEILQIAARTNNTVLGRLDNIVEVITGSGIGYSGFWVNPEGDLILSYAGAFPAIGIEQGDLIIVHADAPPPFSIDATGSVILEV